MPNGATSTARLPTAQALVPLAAFLVFTVATLFVVTGVVGISIRSSDPAELLSALGDLGQRIMADASWLFPSLAGILFALAVVPGRLLDEEDVEQLYRLQITRLMPMVVGVAATSSLALLIIGVCFSPGEAPGLLSPLLLSAVTISVAYALTVALVHRPGYRIAVLTGRLDEANAAHAKTTELQNKTDRRHVGPLSATLTVGAVLAVAVLSPTLAIAVFLAMTGRWDEAIPSAFMVLILVMLAVVATGIGALASVLFRASRRSLFDQLFLTYMSVALGVFGVVAVGAGFTSPDPLTGIALALPLVIPTLSLWVAPRHLPIHLRRLSLNAALQQFTLRLLEAHRGRLKDELMQLEPRSPAPPFLSKESDDEFVRRLSREI